MSSIFDRLITLCIGIVIGAVTALALMKHPEQSDEIEITPDPTVVSSVVPFVSVESPAAITDEVPTQPALQFEPDFAVSPVRLPAAYEDHIRPKQRQISFADIHSLFKDEPRDESWAAAMESGINHYLANSGSGDWAVVEYVECRSRICEIAGYRTGTDNHPKELVNDFVSSGIWHGQPSVHLKRFGDQNIKRFVIVISSYSDDEYRAALSPD